MENRVKKVLLPFGANQAGLPIPVSSRSGTAGGACRLAKIQVLLNSSRVMDSES